LLPRFPHCVVCCRQEQAGEWEHERLNFDKKISELREQNEQLTSELNNRTMTIEKLKNKVYDPHVPRLDLVYTYL